MDKTFVEKYIAEKISNNENKMSISFFELRVKNNLSEEKTKEFLDIAKAYLEKANFSVFTSGEYTYKGAKKQIQSNELLVAIKNEKNFR